MLASILRVSAWLGLLACVPSVIIALQSGFPSIAVLDVSMLAMVVVLYRFERISYRSKAVLFCLGIFILGVGLLSVVGVHGQLYLVACAVLTSLLLGTRAGLIAAGASAIALAGAGLLGVIKPEALQMPRDDSGLWWLTAAINFALVTSVLSIAVGLFLSRLEQALEEEVAARQAAAGQRELLRTFVDTVPDVVYSKDAAGRFRIVNAATLTMFGLTHEREMLDKTVFDLYPREIAERLHDEDMQAMAGRPVFNREVETRDAGGHARWYLTMKVPVCGPDGAITGVIGVSRNITDRKQLEEQLRQAQKMEAVGQLAGGVAHDFNNLLTIIVGFTELLRIEAAAYPALLEPVDAISDAADRATTLTRQLLAFSRQSMLQLKVLDLNATITDTGRMLSRLIGAKIRITLVLDPSIARVRLDPGQFGQVLMNLAVNARDAMPGGGTLTVATQEIDLSEALASRLEAAAGPHVMITVSDTGVGMPTEVLARIFDPFYTTKDIGKGTGLGLAMVFGIVRQSGGSISADSVPGQGSSFRIYLPVVSDSPQSEDVLVDSERSES